MTIDEELAADRRRVIRMKHIENNILEAYSVLVDRLRKHPDWSHARRLDEWDKFMRDWDVELREIAS